MVGPPTPKHDTPTSGTSLGHVTISPSRMHVTMPRTPGGKVAGDVSSTVAMTWPAYNELVYVGINTPLRPSLVEDREQKQKSLSIIPTLDLIVGGAQPSTNSSVRVFLQEGHIDLLRWSRLEVGIALSRRLTMEVSLRTRVTSPG
ncbi:hypothetical protein GW17_00057549 [Ensete ventricosum]|nr:hypothetical protein GW17_00057549 [Ensete ventricosum]